MSFSVQFRTDHVLVRGQDGVLRAPVYSGSQLVAPSSGTCTVYDAGGNVVVSGAIVLDGLVATLPVPASLTAERPLSDDWYAEWVLVVGGTTLTCANIVHLARRRMYPVLTQSDLTSAMTSIDGGGSEAIHSITDLSPYIDEAWVEIENRLNGDAKRAELVMSPAAFRACHKHLALSLLFADLVSHLNNDGYVEIERRQRELYEAAWGALSFRYDADRDGRPDSGREGPQAPLFAM